MSGNSSGEEPNAASQIFQPTRVQLAKWHTKSYLKAAAFVGVAALAVILYFAFAVLVFHHLPKWLP